MGNLMNLGRRDLLRLLTATAMSGVFPSVSRAVDDDSIYDVERFGNARVLHITDTHAQLNPVFFREPSVNLGVGSTQGKPPHVVGRAFLDYFGIKGGGRKSYAFTSLDYEEAAHRYGKLGGFAHLKTLIDRLRVQAGSGRSLLLDGGDLWQGSGLANLMQGGDMVEAANLLGIEAMTGHWEFTYDEKTIRHNLANYKGEFLAQNVFLTPEAAFNDAPTFDSASGRVFKPASIKNVGGHTHDAVPRPILISNAKGKTLVTTAGSSGKFLAVLDLDIGKGAVKDVRYYLLPVFSNLLKPNEEMQRLIDRLHAPHKEVFTETLATAGQLMYRRGNFNGPMDQMICDALRQEMDAQIALSPGFRWGNTVLAGQQITMEDLLSETAITYPEVYVQEMTGSQLKAVMEDICDNLFNPDPYYQQGGDMVRTGGMNYTCAPTGQTGHRISDMTLDDGRAIEDSRTYRVAGWASVNQQQGKPVWEVVAKYLRAAKTLTLKRFNAVRLKDVAQNPGIAGAD